MEFPQIFKSKQPLPFNLKRPAYSRHSQSPQDDQGLRSQDQKFILAKKYKFLQNQKTLTYETPSIEFKKPGNMPISIINEIGKTNRKHLLS